MATAILITFETFKDVIAIRETDPRQRCGGMPGADTRAAKADDRLIRIDTGIGNIVGERWVNFIRGKQTP